MKKLDSSILFVVCACTSLLGACDKSSVTIDDEATTTARAKDEQISAEPSATEKKVDEALSADWSYGPILYQPLFKWSDQTESANGTAFLTSAGNGRVVAVGSKHYILGDVDPVTAGLSSIATGEMVLSTTDAWGPIGNGNPQVPPPGADSREDDYFFLPFDGQVPDRGLVELDERDNPELDERIWFPNKAGDGKWGYNLVGGWVAYVKPDWIVVALDEGVALQSQSGTPIFSQETGKAIGSLYGSGTGDDGTPLIFLVRARHIRQGLAAERTLMPLPQAAAAEKK